MGPGKFLAVATLGSTNGYNQHCLVLCCGIFSGLGTPTKCGSVMGVGHDVSWANPAHREIGDATADGLVHTA